MACGHGDPCAAPPEGSWSKLIDCEIWIAMNEDGDWVVVTADDAGELAALA
jgi:hypothetical protein